MRSTPGILPGVSKILEPDFLKKAVRISLMVLWASFAFSTALMQVAFYVAFGFWCLLKWREGWGFPKIEKQIVIPLLFFAGLSALSILWSESPYESLRGILKILRQIMSFVMVPDAFTSREHLRRFEPLALGVAALLFLDGFFQYFYGKDLIRSQVLQYSMSGGRVSASFKTYGLFASYLICVVPWVASLAWDHWKRRLRILGLGLGAMTLAGIVLIFLTRSRGAVLALTAGSVILPFLYSRRKRFFLLPFLFLILVCFLLPRHFIIHHDIQGKEQSLYERFYLWDRALSVIRAKPWGGTGINTYAKAHGKYDKRLKPKLLSIRGTPLTIHQNPDGSVSFMEGDQEWRSDPDQKKIWVGGKLYDIYKKSDEDYFITNDIVVRNYYAHNGYLQMAAETGIPSLLFFLLFLGAYFFQALRFLKRRQARVGESPENGVLLGLLVGMSNFLIFACVDTVLHNTQAVLLFWYLAGLQLAYQQVIQKEDLKQTTTA